MFGKRVEVDWNFFFNSVRLTVKSDRFRLVHGIRFPLLIDESAQCACDVTCFRLHYASKTINLIFSITAQFVSNEWNTIIHHRKLCRTWRSQSESCEVGGGAKKHLYSEGHKWPELAHVASWLIPCWLSSYHLNTFSLLYPKVPTAH